MRVGHRAPVLAVPAAGEPDRAVHLDDPVRVDARLLVQPVDVLRDDGGEAALTAGARRSRGGRRSGWPSTPDCPAGCATLAGGRRDRRGSARSSPVFSASGFFVHTPFGPRKSGMPESVEIPAPVSTTIRSAARTIAHARAMSSSVAASDIPIHPPSWRQSTFASGFPRTCPRQSRRKRWFRRRETRADAMGGADGRAAHRRDPGSRERRRPDRRRRDRPRRRRRRLVATCRGGPNATCDLATVAALAARHAGVRQFVVLATSGFAATSGTAFVAARGRDGVWRCQTDTVAASFGSNGTRALADRRSGDGTTPAGVFPLGKVTAWDGQTFSVFGNSPDPGVRANVAYRAVRNEDCWGATPGRGPLQPPREPPELPRAGRRMAAPVRRRVLTRGGDRRQPRPGVGRRSRRDAVRRGDLPAPSLVHRRRPTETDERLRVARRAPTS